MTPTKKPAAKKPAHKAVAHKAHKPKKTEAKAHPVADAEVETAPVKKTVKHSTQSFYAVGKRKTAVAQATISSGSGEITVNKLPLETYFGTAELRYIVLNPMTSIGLDKSLNVRAKLHGGGIHAQAESLRHAISRALIQLDPESRRTLKKQGFLTRDPRVKERKKPGLKRARRAPQFSKR